MITNHLITSNQMIIFIKGRTRSTRSVPFQAFSNGPVPFRSVPAGAQNGPVPFPFRSSGTERNGKTAKTRSVPVGSEFVHNYVYMSSFLLSGAIFTDISSRRERSERRDGSAQFTQGEARAQRAPDGRAHFKVCEERAHRALRR